MDNLKTKELFDSLKRNQRLNSIDRQFRIELPIKYEACLEIEAEELRLKAIKSIINEYNGYLTEWGQLNNILFKDSDSEKITDIEGNIVDDFSFFNQEKESIEIIYSKYLDYCSQIKKYGGEKLKILEKKINFKKQFKENELNKKAISKRTGFTCNLHPDTVKEIYIFMAGENYLSGNLTDFQAIFSKVSIPVENPVKWQIFNKRGTKSGRGNQTALFEFLKLMLGTVSNSDLKICRNLFIDKKGYFIENDLLRPDKDKIKTFGFETPLKEIFKKADQPKNQ